MNLGKKSRFSLCQLLEEIGQEQAVFLLHKHDVTTREPWNGLFLTWLKEIVLDASHDSLGSLLDELVRTHHAIRESTGWNQASFDQRWDDLLHCLELNGYRVVDAQLIQIEPVVEGQEPIEDDLTRALQESGLPQAQEIEQRLDACSDAFRRDEYNDCLNNARVALNTLARDIAAQRSVQHSGSYDPEKWGQVLAYLRQSGFIVDKQEEGLSGVYSFLSPGAHVPIDFSEREYARLGRNLVLGMCYFLVKRYLGN